MLQRLLALLVSMAFLGICPGWAATVENDRLVFAFDAQGRLARIYNKVTRQECIHGPGKLPLRVLYLRGSTLAPVRLAVRSISPAGKQRLVLRYGGEGVDATVEVLVREGSAKSLWTLTVSNAGDREVVEVVFPDLEQVRIGESGADDTLVRPNRFGQKIPNPARNLLHEAGEEVEGVPYVGWWNQETLIYSGSAGMFWMDLYDPTGGLYLASEDESLLGGYLTATESGAIGLSLGKYLHVLRGQRYTLRYAVGVHTGDWRWGADRYREWAARFMRKPHIPRWVREMPNWYWRAMLWSMGPQKPPLTSPFTFADLDGRLLDGAMALHSDVVGLAGQEFLGHDFGFWWPDPTLGGEDLLRERMRRVRRRGGHVVPYINPIYTWRGFPDVPHAEETEVQQRLLQIPSGVPTPDWSFFQNYVARRYDGSHNLVEQHYYGDLAQMCMASRPWQDYVLWWTHRYATHYGFSGVQWDQIGAYPSQYCSNWSHGHAHGGVGPPGTLELCRRIYHDPVYRVDPDFYIWYEGASDLFSQYLHSCHSGFDHWMAYPYPEMIQYTFPDNWYGGEYNGNPNPRGQAAIRAARSVELSFLCRYKLGTGGGVHMTKIAKMAELQNALKGVYWYTRYRSDLGVQAPAGIWTRVLEIDPRASPYVGRGGYIIPYADLRASKTAWQLRLSRQRYRLNGIRAAYWYPGHLHGERERLRVQRTHPGYFTIDVPGTGAVSLFDRAEGLCQEDGSISTIGAVVLSEQELRPLTVRGPRVARRGEEVVLTTGVQEVLGGEASVWAEFGTPPQERGLFLTEVADGVARRVVKAGRPCIQTDPAAGGKSHYLYFDVRDPRFPREETVAEVVITYFDEGHAAFRVQYNSTDAYAMPYPVEEWHPAHKGSAVVHTRDTRQWRTATLLLPDACFADQMAGPADIRIDSMGGTHFIAAVRVTRRRTRFTPVGGVTVCVGDDRRVTDQRGVLRYRFGPQDPGGAYILDVYKDGTDGYLPASSVLRLID